MVILIGGASHTGKTLLSQRLMERYNIPYLSIDHLKMGLIRSGQTALTVYDDEALVPYLWSIVCEIVKTVIENGQNLIVEGCYIPFDWQKHFEAEYLSQIKYFCLVMTERYIEENFGDIVAFENAIEKRLCGDIDKKALIEENRKNMLACASYGLNAVKIDGRYSVENIFKALDKSLRLQ